jgi:hypothetical protein
MRMMPTVNPAAEGVLNESDRQARAEHDPAMARSPRGRHGLDHLVARTQGARAMFEVGAGDIDDCIGVLLFSQLRIGNAR